MAKNGKFNKKRNCGKKQKFGQKLTIWPKMEILAKNGNFGQKWKFWPKMEILAKNGNFGQKSKFWSKIEILIKIEILVEILMPKKNRKIKFREKMEAQILNQKLVDQ